MPNERRSRVRGKSESKRSRAQYAKIRIPTPKMRFHAASANRFLQIKPIHAGPPTRVPVRTCTACLLGECGGRDAALASHRALCSSGRRKVSLRPTRLRRMPKRRRWRRTAYPPRQPPHRSRAGLPNPSRRWGTEHVRRSGLRCSIRNPQFLSGAGAATRMPIFSQGALRPPDAHLDGLRLHRYLWDDLGIGGSMETE